MHWLIVCGAQGGSVQFDPGAHAMAGQAVAPTTWQVKPLTQSMSVVQVLESANAWGEAISAAMAARAASDERTVRWRVMASSQAGEASNRIAGPCDRHCMTSAKHRRRDFRGLGVIRVPRCATRGPGKGRDVVRDHHRHRCHGRRHHGPWRRPHLGRREVCREDFGHRDVRRPFMRDLGPPCTRAAEAGIFCGRHGHGRSRRGRERPRRPCSSEEKSWQTFGLLAAWSAAALAGAVLTWEQPKEVGAWCRDRRPTAPRALARDPGKGVQHADRESARGAIVITGRTRVHAEGPHDGCGQPATSPRIREVANTGWKLAVHVQGPGRKLVQRPNLGAPLPPFPNSGPCPALRRSKIARAGWPCRN